jgi:hypothetical protein
VSPRQKEQRSSAVRPNAANQHARCRVHVRGSIWLN